ncbi:MAG: methyltransferase family protein, partial [Phycisphaerales bacterium]
MIGRALFAIAFCILLPAALVASARSLDARLALPGIEALAAGWLLSGVSLCFMLWSMLELWRKGGGLPMSPYPPTELVRTGPYAVVQHPIYAGTVALCLGLSLVFGSGAALWIVTPLVALGCAAMVLGYERSGLVARFGTLPTPLLRLAPAAESPVNPAERLDCRLEQVFHR